MSQQSKWSYIKSVDQGVANNLTVFFDAVMSENVTLPATVTQYPVESGVTISDHVEVGQESFDIEVFLGSFDSWVRLDVLRNMLRKGALCYYSGRNLMSNCVISNIKSRHNSEEDKATIVTMQIKIVKFSDAQEYVTNYVDYSGILAQMKAASSKSTSNTGKTASAKKAADFQTEAQKIIEAQQSASIYEMIWGNAIANK